ncbi:MAG: FecR family protein, partial [Chloroflexi bacterium]|nr:FecR family protein [Chloroflexota bacterium]
MITPLPTQPRHPTGSLDPSFTIRRAWFVLWTGFAMFVISIVVAGYLTIHYLATSWQPRHAVVAGVSGTVLLQEPTWPRPAPIHEGQRLANGDILWTSTESSAFATVSFWEGSQLMLGPGTMIKIVHLRSNRYRVFSSTRRSIMIELRTGRVETSVTKFDSPESSFTIASLGTTVSVFDGTTDVWLTQPHAVTDTGNNLHRAPFTISCCSTQVLTLDGEATVLAPGGTAILHGNQRATVPMGGAPITADHASWDLLVNWSLQPGTNGLPEGWQVSFDPPQPILDYRNHLAYRGSTARYLHLFSANSKSQHRAISLTQVINRNVQDFLNLKLEVTFRILSQSLPGGGIAGSEYPLRISVDYLSKDGKEQRWFHGYYVKPPSGPYIADPQAQEVTAGRWYETGMPQTTLVLSDLPNPPVYVYSVEFSASGWDFN